ncbi:MAG: (2Fe-2S)-binding protein, partial [Gracilibacteraceae bacterium]|nr:(2Fe-2S)-binding protein [Gracilibacteraceae bacterium]
MEKSVTNDNNTDTVLVTIDGQETRVPVTFTVLEAARQAGIMIPTLCYLKGINQIGSCRICLVEIENMRGLHPACIHPVNEGMAVKTNTPFIRETRKTILELILSDHPQKCLSCQRSDSCELQALTKQLGLETHPDGDTLLFAGETSDFTLDLASPAIERLADKCIKCRRCVSVCKNIQQIGALGVNERGFNSVIAPAFGRSLDEVECITCGQ